MAVTDSSLQNLFESRLQALEAVSLVDAIVDRRSRRFALGSDLDGGPLAYRSNHEPVPLSAEEEAFLVFAASGFTGYALGEQPYAPGSEPETGGGNSSRARSDARSGARTPSAQRFCSS